MKYNNIIKGRFLSRPNRFIASVEIGDMVHTVHVKNTGRCKELLIPGTTVYLSHCHSPARRTNYDLIAVEKQRPSKEPLLINIDSQAPNKAAEEWLGISGLFSENAIIKREVTFGSSRFDFCITEQNRTSYLEVKGVTLEKDGIALFPDAPTERGVKHIKELISCLKQGFGAYLLFVVQMKEVASISPNIETHPEFCTALAQAQSAGVKILAQDCIIMPNSMEIDKPIPFII